MTYVKRYVGGFLDRPTITTPADAAFLNAVETELIRLGGHIANADVDAAAAIARSKLDFGAGLVNADIAAAAAIAPTKVAGKAVKVWATGTQLIPANTRTMVTVWNTTKDSTSGSMWSGGNPSRLVAPVAGMYLIEANIQNVTSGILEIYKNAAGSPAFGAECLGSEGTASASSRGALSVLAYLSVNDYVETSVYQSSGGPLSVGGGTFDSSGASTGFVDDHFAMALVAAF